jgi:hypothetical protein
MKRAHLLLFFRLAFRQDEPVYRPPERRKTPATIEDLAFTYPNIGDSQHALTRRWGSNSQGERCQENHSLRTFSPDVAARN